MATQSITIGQDAEIIGYSTRQKGYGRQSLYVDLLVKGDVVKDVYIRDVFPNVNEHFDFILTEDAFLDEETGLYHDCNGNGEFEKTHDSVIDFLKEELIGHEVEQD